MRPNEKEIFDLRALKYLKMLTVLGFDFEYHPDIIELPKGFFFFFFDKY